LEAKMLQVWINFALCALIILWAGFNLSKYGDIIAEKTGISKLWMGATLLAIITSIPELAAGISAVTIIKLPDLAVADMIGSCLINLFAIAILDIIYNLKGHGPILKHASTGHILTGALSIMLLSITSAGIFFSLKLSPFSFLGIGIFTIILAFIYIFGAHLLFRFEHKDQDSFINKKVKKLEKKEYKSHTITSAFIKFVFYALVTAAAASWLPSIAEKIALIHQLSNTFVGSIFMAIVTSLPEFTVAISAIALGSIDMGIGNLLGSNVFNIAAIFIFDIFYRKGPILAAVSPANAFSATMASLITALAIYGLIYRSQKGIFKKISWDAAGILIIYLITIYILLQL